MREIKFRAWNKKEKYMEPVDDLQMFDNDLNIGIPSKDYFLGKDETEVMQYTGLHDKNGKEIYEGDIVRCKQYIGGNFVEHCIEKGFIEFRNGEFGLHRKQGYYQSLNKFIEYDYKIEVVGNIYENPELLEA